MQFLHSFLGIFLTTVRNNTKLHGPLIWPTTAVLIFFNSATSPVSACFNIHWKHFALLGKNIFGLCLFLVVGLIEFSVSYTAEGQSHWVLLLSYTCTQLIASAVFTGPEAWSSRYPDRYQRNVKRKRIKLERYYYHHCKLFHTSQNVTSQCWKNTSRFYFAHYLRATRQMLLANRMSNVCLHR